MSADKPTDLEAFRLLKESMGALDGLEAMAYEAFDARDEDLLKKMLKEIEPIVERIKNSKE